MLSWKIRDLKPCDDARNVYYLIDAFDVSLYGTRTKGMTSTFHHVPMFVSHSAQEPQGAKKIADVFSIYKTSLYFTFLFFLFFGRQRDAPTKKSQQHD